jgi:hypothetical protein
MNESVHSETTGDLIEVHEYDDVKVYYIPYEEGEFPDGVLYMPYNINTVHMPLWLYLSVFMPLSLIGIFSILAWILFWTYHL